MKNNDKPDKFRRSLFLQPWGAAPNDTLVAYGVTKDDILKALLTFKGTDDIAALVRDDADLDDAYGKVFFHANKSVLYLSEKAMTDRNSWQRMLVLLHETNHLSFIGIHKNRAKDEMEFVAYTQEFLFDQTYRKLTGLTPIGKRDNLLAKKKR